MRIRVLRAFLVAVAALAAGAAMAPGAWAVGLSLTVSGTPERLIVGDTLKLTTRVTNVSAETATDVWTHYVPSAEDPFGDTPTVTALSSGFCTPFGPSLNCSLPFNLAPAGQPGDSVENQVAVSLPTGGFVRVDVGADADPGLSAPGVTWQGSIEPKADIALALSANAETITSGDRVTFKALVTNTTAAGSDSAGVAYGTKVNLSIPPEVEVVSKPDDCTGTALRLTCPIGDLGAGLTAQRLITLQSTQPGAFTVLGSTTWDRQDPTIIDTQGQVTVTVVAPPDTSGSETPTPAPTPTPTASTKARAAGFSTLVSGAPGTGRCLRSRRLSVVLRSIKNVDPVRATIRVTGRKRALVLKGTKARRPFALKLPRSGKATVTLTVTLENGRRYTAKRTYRLC